MKFTGEVLLILLLLITNGRIFFLRKANRDPIVVFAPICLLLSILQVFAWGFEITTVTTLILAVIVFLSNFHAMFRYSEKLYIDHYSPLMYVCSILTVVLSTLLLIFSLSFAPVELNEEKAGASQTSVNYSGNFHSGFTKSRFSFNNCFTLNKFEKLPEKSPHFQNENTKVQSNETSESGETSSPKNIIIFFPDKTGDTFYYKPYLQLLAKEGFTVYSGDFFSKDCKWMHSAADSKLLRRTVMAYSKAFSPQKFNQQKEFYTYNISLECREMFKIVQELEASANINIFLCGDEMSSNALKDYYVSNKNNPNLKGYFLINTIAEYKTPGFGCISQTDPFLASILHENRDYSLSDTKAMVLQTKQYLEKLYESD